MIHSFNLSSTYSISHYEIKKELDLEEISIINRIKFLQAQVGSARVTYNQIVLTANSELAELQSMCKHRYTKYHPDASGNNDWSDECLVCGKEGKHIRRPA